MFNKNLTYMAWQALLASGINASAGIGGNILNNYYSKKQLERQNAYNEQMYHYDNWYNSPSQQMYRLDKAGLNPNLVYGNGAAANTTKGPVRGGDFTAVRSPYENLGSIVGESLQTYQNVRMQESQIALIDAQTENVQARTLTEGANTVLKTVTGDYTREQLRQTEGLWNFNVVTKDEEARQAGIRTDQMLSQLRNLKSDEILKGLDIEYKRAGLSIQQIEKEQKMADVLFSEFRNDLMRLGLTANDPAYMRVLVRMLAENGVNTYEKIHRGLKALLHE